MKKLFGTDGMRGEAGKFPLDAATVRIVGASLANQFIKKGIETPEFIVGRDTRESGAGIEQAFTEGAVSAGAKVVSANVITTPGVAFLTRELNADAGIVISASHNPFHDNGIKIFSPSGRKIDEATERQIEADIFDSQESESVNRDKLADKQNSEIKNQSSDLQKKYLDYLTQEFSELSLSNLKIVVDCANGAASELAPKLLRQLGAEIVATFCEPDGRNINADCGSLHIEKLQARVKSERADFGVAFDGDADRALFVDECGEIVDGDATLWAMALHLQDHGNLAENTVVATVMSNLGLEVALESRGIKLLRTAVGDKYVLEELLKTGTSLGGEQSGHIIFPKRSLVGDGLLTTLFLLETMQEKRAKLSGLINGFKRFPQILVNVKVREKAPFESVPKISAEAAEIESLLGAKGRLLLRYSGTENLARVMLEGENQEEINALAQRLAATIRAEIG